MRDSNSIFPDIAEMSRAAGAGSVCSLRDVSEVSGVEVQLLPGFFPGSDSISVRVAVPVLVAAWLRSLACRSAPPAPQHFQIQLSQKGLHQGLGRHRAV